MRAPRLRNERGMALAVAIFALVVIGALVAGTFYSGWMEQQTGQNTFYATQAAEAADAGLSEAISVGDAMVFEPIPIGGSVDLGSLTIDGDGYVTVSRSASRLTESVFLVRALGERTKASGGVLASRTVGSLTRLIQPDISLNAGLTAIGRVTVTGNSEVSGRDEMPLAWSAPPAVDCPPQDDVTGIHYNGTATRSGSATITGDPPLDNDHSLTSENMLGNTNFEQLKALATIILSGNVSGLAPVITVGVPPRCDTSIQNNWGEPLDKLHPCFNYFPIVYHHGDLSISGSGHGQGILLVEGNLDVQGRIDFYGPVIATGAVNLRGTGSDDIKFYGGVVAQDVNLDDSRLSGNAQVNYSSCAIKRALKGTAVMQPLTERAWVQLYQ
jgi:hypothetical protein